ncbi:MAG: dUTP diphosphatase [Bacteroidales bacterium]|jgi:dUTP pyrophosphatase|nr:dUTP diphosphatase [Bacteroidales bacterium]
MIENQFEDFVMVQVGIKKLYEDVKTPVYQTQFSSGCDVHAYNEDGKDVIISNVPGKNRALIKTGIVLELPNGYECQVRARSGLSLKNGITLANGIGTIDNDYKNEVGVIIINHGEEDFVVKHGDRIAQLVFNPFTQAKFCDIENVSETKRGLGGFGHTGV